MHRIVIAALLLSSAAIPNGWKLRVDGPKAAADSVVVTEESGSLAITTAASAGTLYKPGEKADGDYELTAVFSELEPAKTPQAYGLVVGGVDLDKDTGKYATFLVRHDGRFSIQRFTGRSSRPIVAWRTALTMKEPKAVQTTNTLTIRTAANTVRFFIDDKEVAKLTRAQIGDGVVGVRVSPGLHLQVSKFALTKPK